METVVKRRQCLRVLPALFPGVFVLNAQSPPPNEFFAMDTAIAKGPIQKPDIDLVSSLGYHGVSVGASGEAEWQYLTGKILPWLDENKLKLFAVYGGAQVRRGGYTIDAAIRDYLPLLRDRRTVVWLPLSSKEFKPSDRAADENAVAAVRDVADIAVANGLLVSLYPHAGSLLERVRDAVRIAEKAGRPNVKVTFNLCHWLRTEGTEPVEDSLKLAKPHLYLVTINGADRDGKQWIQPLGSGDFDVGAFLRKLCSLGYGGPIGLQGYGVAKQFQIEPAENLKRSIAAWRALFTP